MPDLTVLSFDYGTQRLGVAIGNTLTRQARPLEIISPRTRERRFELIQQLLDRWEPELVIVGLPLAPDGSDQYTTLQARRFANQLRGRFGLTVEMVDERCSSLEAQTLLGTHDPDDAVAAAVILQRYFDIL